MKVTPAHDPNDYQTGLRHDLPMINLLNPDGTYNENAGEHYAGLDRHGGPQAGRRRPEGRTACWSRTSPTRPALNYSDRSKTPIEPYLSDQWFVRMGDDPDGAPGFAQQAMDAVTSGKVQDPPPSATPRATSTGSPRSATGASAGSSGGATASPSGSASTCSEDDLKLAFGGRADVSWRRGRDRRLARSAPRHDLAADALGDGPHARRKTPTSSTPGSARPSGRIRPSAGPSETPELTKYYPTSVLSTARDIITLWVARMVIFGQFNMGDVPFRDVYIHPVIQDGDGKRMSKIGRQRHRPGRHHRDLRRRRPALHAGPRRDRDAGPADARRARLERCRRRPAPINTSEVEVREGRTFPNKFWNAARFALMNLEGYEPGAASTRRRCPVEDRWILGRPRRDGRRDDRRPGGLPVRRGDPSGSATSPGASSATGTSSSSRTRLRDPETRPDGPARAGGGAGRPLPAAAPDHAVSSPSRSGRPWASSPRVEALPEPIDAAASVCIAPWPVPGGAWTDAEARATWPSGRRRSRRSATSGPSGTSPGRQDRADRSWPRGSSPTG